MHSAAAAHGALIIVLVLATPPAGADTTAPQPPKSAPTAPTVNNDLQKQLDSIGKPPLAAKDLVPWLDQNSKVLPPVVLAGLAKRLFDQSPADALEWFSIAYARAVYDAQRCSDPTAGADLGLALSIFAGQPLVGYRLGHPDEYATAEQRALTRSDLFTDAVSPAWICGHGIAAYGQALSGQQQELQLKPRDEWPAMQQHIREAMAGEIKKATEAQAVRKALPADTVELRVPHKGVPFGIAWSPDGKQLAMTLSGDSHVAMWDPAAGTVLKEFDRGTQIPDAVAFADDDQLVTSAATDAPNIAVVSEFDSRSGVAIQRFTQVAGNAAFALDRAEHLIAYLSRSGASVGVTLAKLDGSAAMPPISVEKDVPSALAFGRGGTLAVGTLGGKILLFDASNGQLRRTIDAFDHDWVESLAFSLDGQHLAAGFSGGSLSLRGPDGQMHSYKHQTTLGVWNTTDNSQIISCSELVRNEGTTIRSVAWSPDNRHLAYSGYERVLLIDINAPHPHVVMQFSQNTGQFSSASLAFSPDGTRLATTGDNVARIVPIMMDDAASKAPDGASCQLGSQSGR